MICPIDKQQCGWRCQTPCTSDDTRLVIEGYRLGEDTPSVYKGPTFAERRAAHERGECHALCGICITEAESVLAQRNP